MQALEYRVGRFTLQPHRQLLDGGVPIAIGHKALELLSVLAKAEGALVTKDELMSAVWPNLIVEDNALQAHVVALRKVLGEEADLLSTARGVGYRLAAAPRWADASQPEGSSPRFDSLPKSTATPPRPGFAPEAGRRGLVLSALSAAVPLMAVVAAGLWPVLHGLLPWSAPAEQRVAVAPFEVRSPEPETRRFAANLDDALSGTLSADRTPVLSPEASATLDRPAGPPPEKLNVGLMLQGDVQRIGDAYDVRANLTDVGEHAILWSDEFKGPTTAPQALQTTVAAHMDNVAHWAALALNDPSHPNAAALAALLAGDESLDGVRNGADGVDLADYRKLLAEAPDFSWAHSRMAVAEAFHWLAQPAERKDDSLRADAQREADRALQLQPHNGEAYTALELITSPFDFKTRESLLLRAAAVEPSFEPAGLIEGRLLWSAGRAQEALAWFQRSHALDPLHGGATFTLALSLASEGRSAESQALVSTMEAEWPETSFTQAARLWTAIVGGSPSEALAALDEPEKTGGMPQPATEAFRAALSAVRAGGPPAKRQATTQVVAAAKEGWLEPGQAALLLAMLGDVDGALRQAAGYSLANPGTPPYLFLPAAAPLRADPRFMQIAERLGLVAYWRETGRWPDFCRQPDLPYDCRAEAAKAAAQAAPPPRSAGPRRTALRVAAR